MLKVAILIPLALGIVCCVSAGAQNNDDIPDREQLESAITLASSTIEDRPEDAIAGLLEVYPLAIQLKDTPKLGRIVGLLGVGHYYLSDDASALTYWKEALVLAEAFDDQEFLAGLYNNLGNGYGEVDLDSSFYFYRKAITSYQNLGMRSETADILANLSISFYEEVGDRDSAYF